MSGPTVVMCAPISSPSGPETVAAPPRTVTLSPVISVIVVPVAALEVIAGVVAVCAWAGAAGVTASAVTAAAMSGTDLPMKESVNGIPRLDQRPEVVVTLQALRSISRWSIFIVNGMETERAAARNERNGRCGYRPFRCLS